MNKWNEMKWNNTDEMLYMLIHRKKSQISMSLTLIGTKLQQKYVSLYVSFQLNLSYTLLGVPQALPGDQQLACDQCLKT